MFGSCIISNAINEYLMAKKLCVWLEKQSDLNTKV